jgi:hypothetical protein
MSHKIVHELKLLTSQLEDILQRPRDPTFHLPEPSDETTEDVHQIAYNLAQVSYNLARPDINYLYLAADMAQVSSDLAKLASTLANILHMRSRDDSTDSSMPPLHFSSENNSSHGLSVDICQPIGTTDITEEIIPSTPLSCHLELPINHNPPGVDLDQKEVKKSVDRLVEQVEQVEHQASQPTPKKISWNLGEPSVQTLRPPLKKILIRRKK